MMFFCSTRSIKYEDWEIHNRPINSDFVITYKETISRFGRPASNKVSLPAIIFKFSGCGFTINWTYLSEEERNLELQELDNLFESISLAKIRNIRVGTEK